MIPGVGDGVDAGDDGVADGDGGVLDFAQEFARGIHRRACDRPGGLRDVHDRVGRRLHDLPNEIRSGAHRGPNRVRDRAEEVPVPARIDSVYRVVMAVGVSVGREDRVEGDEPPGVWFS